MRITIQPIPLEEYKLFLQARRLERESEERRLAKLKAQLIAKKEERKPVERAS